MTKITNSRPATPAASKPKGPSQAHPKAIKTRLSTKAKMHSVVAPRSGKSTQPPERQTKLASVIAMLRDKRGASIDQLVKATGWQKHSVRGAISGALKKKLGLKVVSEKTDAGRSYRIVG